MLRIESYVTPIILSYVDKYIKNLKPEDSQVSLWGGDAVFNNLDLRLEVLEQELKLPFSFVNGHIHELRIHVPWTKLTSEPIIITINTIECILKLKDYENSDSESSSQTDTSDVKLPEFKKKQRRQENEVPTSYIQGLISRVINNVSVVCNNVILKYVEDDIVLSINAKTLELKSVDHKWIPSFIDLSAEDLTLRNLATLTDLTVCLDKRNASGKIENYQEPLLYRCSLTCRMVRHFESVYSHQPIITRYDVLCPQLHFSLSDTQLPMFLRLLELTLALYFKQLQYQPPKPKEQGEAGTNVIIGLEGEEKLSFEGRDDRDSWSSWMWSIGSSLLPIGWEEGEDSAHSLRYHRQHSTMHVGIYVEIATWVFKLTESVQDATVFGPSKMHFTPFMKIEQQGSFMSAVVKGLEAVNVQLGISSVTVDPVGNCICGIADSDMVTPDFVAAEDHGTCGTLIRAGRESQEYLSMSLFDEKVLLGALEFWDYQYIWDNHLITVTESTLLERTGAFGIDYLYVMDIPSDVSSEKLSELDMNPEYSNMSEKALCRIVCGPFEINMTSGFYHRLSAIKHALDQYDYTPYCSQTEDAEAAAPLSIPSEEEVFFLETNPPLRTYLLTCIEPCIKIHCAQHPYVDMKNVFNAKRRKRNQKVSSEFCMARIMPVPAVVFKTGRLDLHYVKPMYPQRLVSVACRLNAIPAKMLHNCHTHLTVKLHHISVHIQDERSWAIFLLQGFSPAIYVRTLLMPSNWGAAVQPWCEYCGEANQLSVTLSMPQILLIHYLVCSWFVDIPSPEELRTHSLINDAVKYSDKFSVLNLKLHFFESKICETSSHYSAVATAGSVSLALCRTNLDVICYLMSGPETSTGLDATDTLSASEKLVKAKIQVPKIWSLASETLPTVLNINVLKVSFFIGPQIILWLKYSPKTSQGVDIRNTLFFKRISDTKIVKIRKASECDASDNLKLESSSATPSEARTTSRLGFFGRLDAADVYSNTESNWKDKFVEFYPLICNLLIHVEVDSFTVFLPSSSLNISSDSGLVNAVHRIYLTRGEKTSLGDTNVICLPKLLLQNSAQKHVLLSHVNDDIPIHLPQVQSVPGKTKLPWSLSLTNFHMYSLQGHGRSVRLPVLSPVNTTATLSVTPKFQGPVLSQIATVIHLDMSPIDISSNRRQVEGQVAFVESILNLVALFISQKETGTDSVSSAVRTSQSTQAAPKLSAGPEKLNQISHSKIQKSCNQNVHNPLIYSPIQPRDQDTKFNNIITAQAQSDQPSLVSQPVISKPSISDAANTISLTENEELEENKLNQLLADQDSCGSALGNSVLLTCWVQWTVARVSTDLYSHGDDERRKLHAEIEDLTMSIDLHEIYRKVKCKIANFSILHFIKRNSDWISGEHEGVILTGGDQITRDLKVVNPTNKSAETNVKTLSSAISSDLPKTHGFLSVTFTMAQCKNVHSKWNQMVRKHFKEERFIKECTSPQYLSEVDIRVQPFDCIFYPKLLMSFISVYEPWLLLQVPKSFTQIVTDVKKPNTLGLSINNKVLPLMYLQTETIRVFLPSKHPSAKDSNIPDVILIQLDSILISPQVDNPLSRIILRPDIFNAAEQARILGVPGSEVEDRQYQIDFIGFSVSTGSWNDLAEAKQGRPRSLSSEILGVRGENPALEWNNYDPSKEISEPEAIMYPLIVRLDIKIIAAPAIAYIPAAEDDTCREPLLVAGHSLEVNATTDIDIYSSIAQILLSEEILADISACLAQLNKYCNCSHGSIKSAEVLDSGVDCDISSIELSKAGHFGQEGDCSNAGNVLAFVPVEILITGSKITLNIFEKCLIEGQKFSLKGWQRNKLEQRAKIREKQLALEVASTESEPSPLRGKRTLPFFSEGLAFSSAKSVSHISEMEDGYEGSEEESAYEPQHPSSEPQLRFLPLIYVCVSQPHTFIMCQPLQQKVVVSCFDFITKSVPKGFSIKATEMKKLPKPEDYTTSWFETRPGDPHPKTGIPPALLTFTVYDFLHKPAHLSVEVGRPFRLSLSQSKWDQIQHVMSKLQKLFPVSEEEDAVSAADHYSLHTTRISVTGPEENILYNMQQFSSYIDDISLVTSQISVNVEVIRSEKYKSELHGSISGLILSLTTSRKRHIPESKPESVNELACKVDIQDLQLKTMYHSLDLHTFLKPWCISGVVKLVWLRWSSSPYIELKIQSEVFQVDIGPENIFCFSDIYDYLKSFAEQFASSETSNKPRNHTPPDTEESYSDLFFQDDLRAGVFQYLCYPSTSTLEIFPQPYQVVFDKALGIMVWCYPEPRALIRVDIYPVPFIAASEVSTVSYGSQEADLVLCALQYYDTLREFFVTYQKFHLSESKFCQLELPGMFEKRLLAVSTTWRVCINYREFDDENKGHIIVSPETLAACMRVDSLFSVNILPKTEAVITLRKSETSLVSNMNLTGSRLPFKLKNFALDKTVPENQSAVSFSLDNACLRTYSWNNAGYIDVAGVVYIHVLNYKFLTNNMFLEPCPFQIGLSIQNNKDLDKPICFDMNVMAKTMFLHVNQSSVYTLVTVCEGWQQAFSIVESTSKGPNKTIKKSLPAVLMTNYILTNRTTETIRFGQVNTDENLILGSGAMHLYSWRSHKLPTVLQICTESTKWKWSEPFCLDNEDIQMCSISHSSDLAVKVFVTCKKLSPHQMQVTLSGIFAVANCLVEDIEFRVINKNQRDESPKQPHIYFLKSQSVSSSLVRDPHSLRVRVSNSQTWSGEIPLNCESSRESVMVKIPLKSKKENTIVLCKVYSEKVGSVWRHLVLFSPQCVIRSHFPRSLTLHITTPSTNTTEKSMVKGRGNMQALSCDLSATHQLTFQLSPDMKVSQPPIPITRAMADQISHSSSNGVQDLTDFAEKLFAGPEDRWPYIDSTYIEGDFLFADQPKIDLQIGFSCLYSQCNTLVVDVRPWTLIINHTGTEILLQEGEAFENVWYIPSGAVFAPPKLENFFTFGVISSDNQIFSSPLQLSKEERWYTLKFEGRIPKCGATNISIPLKDKICFITVLSRYEENIQVLHLVPTYSIANNTTEAFEIQPMFVQATEHKLNPPQLPRVVKLDPMDNASELKETALLFFDTIRCDGASVVQEDMISLQIGQNGLFAHPVTFQEIRTDQRVNFTLPSSVTAQILNLPYILTVHPHNSQVKFVIQFDISPQMVIHNNTSSLIVIGQSSLQEVGVMEEELDVFSLLPSVPPSKSIYYTFPNVSSLFPSVASAADKHPKLHLSQPDVLDNAESEDVLWSQGININQCYDQFVSVPGFGDVKVHTENVNRNAHIYIDPASRVEISAKDIRSRISSQAVKRRVGIPSSSKIVLEECDTNGDKTDEVPPEAEGTKCSATNQLQNMKVFYCTFISAQFSVIIKDDVSSHDVISEVLRVSMDNFILSVRPKLDITEKLRCLNCGIRDKLELTLIIEDAQIDNQLYAEGKYDFPVILVRQGTKLYPLITPFEPLEQVIQRSYNDALVSVSLVLERGSAAVFTDTLNIRIKPITMFIEDSIIYSLSEFLKSFLAVSTAEVWRLRREEEEDDKNCLIMKLPSELLLKSCAMTRPIHIRNLHIEPISLLLSVHASVKLYLALDQSPLHFKEYKRTEVLTTGYSLGHNMAVHYLSSALFRAGWVVSSLDLLGNPGGFARMVGSGIRDFVQLPYRGILQGPWAFIAGITNGSLSLVKHLTAGTLVSVTNLACSVARNMERLSLDEEHWMRNEANRRMKPSGLTQGVVQGLTSFGISMLGAVGGLIHQPMQALLNEGVTPSSLVGGLSKGLVGIVTKPIGGAADFVVHTGQGMLQGAGWKQDQKPRTSPIRDHFSIATNSPLKMVWKLLVALPTECRRIICSVDATLVTSSGTFSPVTVILTPQVLFILGVEEDAQQHAFSLHELEWKVNSQDPTLLYFEKAAPPPPKICSEDVEPITGCPERVADYVRSTCSEGVDGDNLTSEEEESDESRHPSRVKLFLSPQMRKFLVSSVNISVRAMKGKGFIS